MENDEKGAIKDEAKGKVFEKGFSLGSSTGLGLPMVKKIVKSYGGEIVLGDSEMGGARFDLVIHSA